MDTTFIDKATIITAEWLNAINDSVYGALNGATTPSLARTALDVPQDTAEIVPQVRVDGSWLPLSDQAVPLHAATHAFDSTDPLDHDTLLNADGVKHIDHSTVSILAGSGMAGGGTIEGSRTLSFSYTLEQALNCGLYNITNMAGPVNDSDAATKKYVDDHLTSATSPLNVSGIPTSDTDLVSGDVWSNAGVLTIVP